MYLKLILSIIGGFISINIILGQPKKNTYIATEIKLSTGIVYTDFFDKQSFPLFLCWGDCYSVKQTTKPSFIFGGQVNFVVKPRHRLGFGYHWQQIKIEQEILSSFGSTPFIHKWHLDFHSFFIQHQFQRDITQKNRWWSNAIGIDLSLHRKDLRKWPLFYRTSFAIPLKIANIQGFVIEPFFQIGITNYSSRIVSEKFVRPFMVGLLVQYSLKTR